MKPQPLIVVRSVPDSARFYCQLLGAQQGHGGEHYEQLLLNGELIMQLHSFDPDANHESLADPDLPLGNGPVLWFETDDFAALEQRLKEHGMTPERPPSENPFAKQMEVWLRDPDGYRVVIAGPSAYTRQPVQD